MNLVTDKKDLELIKHLEGASPGTQIGVAINLVKIGRYDIINQAKIPSLLRRLQNNEEWINLLKTKKDCQVEGENNSKFFGEEEARKLWDGDLSMQKEFNNDFETYLSYCKAVDAGHVKICTNRIINNNLSKRKILL